MIAVCPTNRELLDLVGELRRLARQPVLTLRESQVAEKAARVIERIEQVQRA